MRKTPLRSLSALAVAAIAVSVTLAGCTASPADPASAGDKGAAAAGAKSDVSAFAACLKAEGVESKVGQGGGVMVRDNSEGGEGGGEGVLYNEWDEGGSWLALQDSSALANDPTTKEAYENCEQKFPDFSQPEFTPPKDGMDPEMQKQQLADAVAFARCGRDKGYSWVADPKADAAAAITIPSSVTEEEFRGLLKDCWDEKSKTPPPAWNAEGELSFDLQAVLDSIPGLTSGGSSVFTQPVEPEEGEG